MADFASNAFGSILSIGDATDGTSVTFTPIAEIRAYGTFEFGGGTFPANAHNMAGGWGRVIPSAIKDFGDLTVGVLFLPVSPTHGFSTGLLGMVGDKLLHDFQWGLQDDDLSLWEFSAFVLRFRQTTPLDGTLDGEFTLRPNGQPGLT